MKYLITFTIVMTMLFPLSSPAQNSVRDDLQKAERSPLFQKKISSSQVSANGLDRVQLHNGVELEFKKYINLTRLDRSEKFEPLMRADIVSEYLRSKPTYTENVLQLQDRLIVERTMTVPMKNGVCQQRNLPVSVTELCFVDGNGPLPDETRKYLMRLREKLGAASPGTEVKDGMTAGQLGRMSDEELLEALLNSDDREIRLVSVLPTEVYRSPTPADLWNTSARLEASNFNNASPPPALASSQFYSAVGSGSGDGNKVFPKKYFLTGFTLGREISDTFEVQIAPSTWLTDRYYVRFEYSLSAGLGLRFPFSVSVESHTIDDSRPTLVTQGRMKKAEAAPSRRNEVVRAVRGKPRPGRGTVQSGGPDKSRFRDHRSARGDTGQVAAGENTRPADGNPVTQADISISVAPVNVASNGSPAYQAVDLPSDKYFNGKEFVLELKAGCKFKASIPGPNINEECPSVGFDRSRDIDPVIGSARAELGVLWVEGAPLGLGIDVWAGTASLDFGIQANLTNGRIGFKASGYNNTLIDNQSTHSFSFTDTNTHQFKVANPRKTDVAFSLNTPSYGFDLELLPVARAKVELDLGYKKWKKTLGPYSVDALSLTVGGFTMGHHEGTVSSHVYSF